MNCSALVFLYLNNSCLIITKSKMYFLKLCLMTAVFLVSFCDGDLIISDFEKDRHWLVTDDLKLLVTFDIKNDVSRALQLKARKSDDGIVIYILYEEEIKMFNILNDGKVSESGTFALNRKIGPAASDFAFDVQPSGKCVVIFFENELYFFSQDDKKLSKLLESDYLIRDALIHPTKRTVYYIACSFYNFAQFLFVYDMKSKVEKQIQIPACFQRIFLDIKENIIWAFYHGKISPLNLTNGVTETILDSRIDEFVVGSDNFHMMNTVYEERNRITSFWKVPKKHQVQKQTTLKDYNIQPALSHFKGSTPVLFDIDEGLIEILDNQFAKTSDKIKLDIAKKPIKSLRSISDDQSTTFFWIHDSNGGVVEYVRTSHKDKATIKRGAFKFQTGGEAFEDLTDFDVFENKFYLSINRGLFTADINYDKHDQSAKHHDEKYRSPIKAIDIQKEQRKLVIFDRDYYLAGIVETPLNRSNENVHALATCPVKILFDQEGFLVSTSTGLYNFRSHDDYELIYSGRNIRNFVLDKEFVYFVSKIDGPSIYKVAKRRAVKLNHDLQLRENGFFTITNVKEIVEEDDKKDPKPNGAASEMTSTEQMFLLLLVHFVMHLLP